VAQTSDKSILALLRRRDPRGFDQAYATYATRIYGFLLRLSGQRDVADDLLQHSFLRLAERGPELRPDSDLRAWLFTVARNAYLSQKRGVERVGENDALEVIRDYAADVEARLMLGDVERALEALRLEDRELLLLVGVEGFEPQEVARILGIDNAALRQRLARARARLLVVLERLPAGQTKSGAMTGGMTE
jgi:RNA polymerase sigma-70 factor (ECF subfamily)